MPKWKEVPSRIKTQFLNLSRSKPSARPLPHETLAAARHLSQVWFLAPQAKDYNHQILSKSLKIRLLQPTPKNKIGVNLQLPTEKSYPKSDPQNPRESLMIQDLGRSPKSLAKDCPPNQPISPTFLGLFKPLKISIQISQRGVNRMPKSKEAPSRIKTQFLHLSRSKPSARPLPRETLAAAPPLPQVWFLAPQS